MNSNTAWNPKALILCTLLPALLLGSWIIEPTHTLWQRLDEQVFWAMNDSLAGNRVWQQIWAVANNRMFDLVAALSMVMLFAHYALFRERQNFRHLVAVGMVIFCALVVAILIGTQLIPVERPSATAMFPDALRLSQLVPSIETKDYSGDSFPGDHGMVLLMCAGFLVWHLPRGYGVIACVLAVLFTLPRLMSGAHWLTDEIVGAVAVDTLVLGWFFATPLQDRLLEKFEQLLSRFAKTG
ncbi:MAG: phosphatase PAP2 family protein [Candidatus Sedimenticola sp. 20ELBAFRAG]